MHDASDILFGQRFKENRFIQPVQKFRPEMGERFIVENAYDPVYGARPLKRYIQKHVETLSAKQILADPVKAKDISQYWKS